MKVQSIHSAVTSYIELLKSGRDLPWSYQYDIIDRMHDEWHLDAQNLKESYNRALDSTVSRRLWHRENFDAKKMMLNFLDIEPDYAKQMFRDLYDESRKVEARIDRFKFYCEELLQMFRIKNPKEIITSHDQDPTMISLYLAAKYPRKYAIYPGKKTFQKVLKILESHQPLHVDDLGRFFKVSQVLNTIGHKNPKLTEVLKQRFQLNIGRLEYRQWTGELMMFMDDASLF